MEQIPQSFPILVLDEVLVIIIQLAFSGDTLIVVELASVLFRFINAPLSFPCSRECGMRMVSRAPPLSLDMALLTVSLFRGYQHDPLQNFHGSLLHFRIIVTAHVSDFPFRPRRGMSKLSIPVSGVIDF